jgi:hypothetical protein
MIKLLQDAKDKLIQAQMHLDIKDEEIEKLRAALAQRDCENATLARSNVHLRNQNADLQYKVDLTFWKFVMDVFGIWKNRFLGTGIL